MSAQEKLKVARKALMLAMEICDAVPTRLHMHGESHLAHIGKLVNVQEDGTHGYAVIRDALTAINAIEQDCNLVAHAKREFLAMGYAPIADCEDDPNKWIQKNILELISVFSKQGHSGMSAPYCIGMFEKLANYKPLGPLTGDDSEWGPAFCDEGTVQNKRCGHVFKHADGHAYDGEAVVFEEPSGCRFTGRYSRQTVTFPYTPRRVVAKVADDATDAEKESAAQAAWAPATAPVQHDPLLSAMNSPAADSDYRVERA